MLHAQAEELTCCILLTGDRQTFSQSPCSSTNPYTFSGTQVAMTPIGAPSMNISKEPLNSGTRMIPTLVPICGGERRERERGREGEWEGGRKKERERCS